MPCLRIVIEVYGGVAQNVYVADDVPETLVEAVIVDWDYEYYDASNCLVRATGLDGEPTLAAVFAATLKPWRLLPTAGIQDVLDRAGLADFGSPLTSEGQPAASRAPDQVGFLRPGAEPST
jgi:hypothetical protein